jgi:carotene epsilon-monooxygenase
MEAVVALAVLLKQFDFELLPNQKIAMTTGATIHTTNGLYMNVRKRHNTSGLSGIAVQPATTTAVV